MIGMILLSLMPTLRWMVALWTGRCWPDYSRAKAELCIGVWLFLVADRTERERSPVRCGCKTNGRRAKPSQGSGWSPTI